METQIGVGGMSRDKSGYETCAMDTDRDGEGSASFDLPTHDTAGQDGQGAENESLRAQCQATGGQSSVGRADSCENCPSNGARPDRPGKKHVAWQSDRDMDGSRPDRDGADPAPHCFNVDTLEHTHPTAEGLNRHSHAENNGLSVPDNIRAQQDESLEPGGPARDGEQQASGEKGGTVEPPPGAENKEQDATGRTRLASTDLTVSPAPLARPLSASADRGRLLAERSLSDNALRPLSADASSVGKTRRLSLPLSLPECAGRLSKGDKEVKEIKLPDSRLDVRLVRLPDSHVDNKEVSHPDSRLDDKEARLPDSLSGALVHKAEKEAALVTYRDKEGARAPDTKRRDSSVKPPRPQPSQSVASVQHRRRPHTAGPVTGRPGSRLSRERSAPAGMGPPRLWELPFSKEELQRALPRRNFFSCHNKALKDAGYHVEEENARPRRKRLLFFLHEDEAPGNGPTSKEAAQPVIHVPSAGRDDGSEDGGGADLAMDTAVQMLSLSERVKRRKSHAAAVQVVECKALQHYLSYVGDNPGEYRHMEAKVSTSGAGAVLHPSSLPADNCHTARLVSMGRVFQQRHGGPRRTDEVLRATYSLNPRAADPYRFAANPQRDKSPLASGLLARKASMFPRKESAVSQHSGEEGSKSGQRSKPGSEMSQKHEAERPAPPEHQLEVERRKVKAEDWARGVTTDQLLRAKLHVLKELGHEERELSQWWLAFRNCLYLRPPPRIRD